MPPELLEVNWYYTEHPRKSTNVASHKTAIEADVVDRTDPFLL